MNEVLATAAQVQHFCEEHGWRFCVIGGIALQRWGEPRVTQDVDVTLLTGFGGEESYVDALLEQFRPRMEGARDFALQRRVLLLQTVAGVGLDVALAGLPFEERVVQRSSVGQFSPQLWLRTCSAEDLIVMKAFADRTRDWDDIENILVRQGERLDWITIAEELAPLCALKEAPEIVRRLETLRKRIL